MIVATPMKAVMLTAGLWLCGVVSAHAQERSEVPITERILSDGTRRYTIPITVGSTQIEAGLDSGSTGLRVLPGVLAAGDAKPGGSGDIYGYGAGTQLVGSTSSAAVKVGATSGTTTLQLVDSISCNGRIPNCPASKIAIGQFGIQGNGLPGEGFKAIIGVNMAEAEVNSPFPALGAKRWIIELPRPGAGTPGRLILNPAEAEIAGFRMLPTVGAYRTQKGGLHDSVKGCIVNDQTKAQACGALLMDTGAPGIVINNSDLRAVWRDEAPTTIGFYDSNGLAAAEQLVIGIREHASRLRYGTEGGGDEVTIMAGLSPYFAFDVLYETNHYQVGLKPRPGAPMAPSGTLLPAKH